MRKSKILARFRAGQPARIGVLGNMIPAFIPFAAEAGMDGLWLDMEHRPMQLNDVQMLLALSHLYDIDIMIRPHTREKASLYRFLEDGAVGLMIPHVSTPEEAEDLVRKVKFPPMGDRGIGLANLQANYGLDSPAQTVVDHVLQETFLFIQLETPLAMANADAIAAVPGLDGLCLGPADLGLRMQHEPEARRLSYEQAMERVAQVAKVHGKYWFAYPRRIEDLSYQRGLASNLFLWEIDNNILLDGLRQSFKEMAEILGAS